MHTQSERTEGVGEEENKKNDKMSIKMSSDSHFTYKWLQNKKKHRFFFRRWLQHFQQHATNSMFVYLMLILISIM